MLTNAQNNSQRLFNFVDYKGRFCRQNYPLGNALGQPEPSFSFSKYKLK